MYTNEEIVKILSDSLGFTDHQSQFKGLDSALIVKKSDEEYKGNVTGVENFKLYVDNTKISTEQMLLIYLKKCMNLEMSYAKSIENRVYLNLSQDELATLRNHLGFFPRFLSNKLFNNDKINACVKLESDDPYDTLVVKESPDACMSMLNELLATQGITSNSKPGNKTIQHDHDGSYIILTETDLNNLYKKKFIDDGNPGCSNVGGSSELIASRLSCENSVQYESNLPESKAESAIITDIKELAFLKDICSVWENKTVIKQLPHEQGYPSAYFRLLNYLKRLGEKAENQDLSYDDNSTHNCCADNFSDKEWSHIHYVLYGEFSDVDINKLKEQNPQMNWFQVCLIYMINDVLSLNTDLRSRDLTEDLCSKEEKSKFLNDITSYMIKIINFLPKDMRENVDKEICKGKIRERNGAQLPTENLMMIYEQTGNTNIQSPRILFFDESSVNNNQESKESLPSNNSING